MVIAVLTMRWFLIKWHVCFSLAAVEMRANQLGNNRFNHWRADNNKSFRLFIRPLGCRRGSIAVASESRLVWQPIHWKSWPCRMTNGITTVVEPLPVFITAGNAVESKEPSDGHDLIWPRPRHVGQVPGFAMDAWRSQSNPHSTSLMMMIMMWRWKTIRMNLVNGVSTRP